MLSCTEIKYITMNKFGISLLFVIIIASFLLFSDLNPVETKAAILVTITIGLFATAIIPEYITALLFFLVAMLFNIAPANIIFSGFQSTALWLVFGGLVIGVAIIATGLGSRIANKLAGCFAGSYMKLITGITMVGVAFAFIMPSAMGRIMLLTPIILLLANHFGFQAGSNGKTGLILASTLGSFLPAFSILPANVPNMILVGIAENQFGISPLFGEYLLLHFPILGLAKAIIIIILIIWLFPDQPKVNSENKIKKTIPISKAEITLAVTLIILLVLWMTDFIHHISPAWIALGGAIFLLLPKVGVVNNELFNSKINYGAIFFIASVIGLGNLIQHSGLGVAIGEGLITILPLNPATPFINYMSISFASTFTGLLTTLPGVPAVMTPLSAEIAEATGLSIKSILMLQVLGFSTILLPYQAPAIIVAIHLAKEKTSSILKPIVIIGLITYTIFLPINYLWWKFLGWI